MPSTMVKSFFLMLLLAAGQSSASDTVKGTKTDDCADIAGLYRRRAQYHNYPNDDGSRQMYITQQGCNIQVLHGPRGSSRPYRVLDGSVNGSAVSITPSYGDDTNQGEILETGDIFFRGRYYIDFCYIMKGAGIWKKTECRDTTGWKDFWGNDCNHYATTTGACNSPCLGKGCASQHCCACGGGSVITTTTTTLIKQAKCWAPTTCKSQTCEAYDDYGSHAEPIPVFANSEPLICGDSPLLECSGKVNYDYNGYDRVHEHCCDPASCHDLVIYNKSSKKYEPWYDARGTEYNCSWYASAPDPAAQCNNLANTLANFGHKAAEACCVCRGSMYYTSTCKDIVPPGETKWTAGSGTSINCASKHGLTYDGHSGHSISLCDEKIYKDGGYTSKEACCKCGGGLTGDEPQPSTVCVDKPGWKSKGMTCADVQEELSHGSMECSFWGCTWPWETCATEACCACGGGTQVEYSTTTTTTWALCIEAKQCEMHACPDGYELKRDSTTYCDDRLLDDKDVNSYDYGQCTVADKFPWRSIRRCQLTTEKCNVGICWDPQYEGFDDCCQLKPAWSDPSKCFGKPRLCSEIPKEEYAHCYDGKVVRENAYIYCNSSSDSPLIACDDAFPNYCCHFEPKESSTPSMVVAEFNLHVEEGGAQCFHAPLDCINTKLEECLMVCSLDKYCFCVSDASGIYVKAQTTTTTTALVQDLCVEPNFPCNSYLCPAGYARTSNYVYVDKPFASACTNWNHDDDQEVWSYSCYNGPAMQNFHTCCEPEKKLSVGDCVYYKGASQGTRCNCQCSGNYKITEVLHGGSSFKLGCVGDDDDYHCNDEFAFCDYRSGESCGAECAVSGCVCDIPKSDLVKSDATCESRYEYDESLANPKHAEKGKKRERKGATNERLANSSLGQKRSRREEMQLAKKEREQKLKLAEKNRVQKLKLAKEKKVQKLKDAEKKRVQKLKDAKTNKRAKAKASPTKTQLLLIAIFSGMAVSAGLVLVIKRRLQRRTVHVPEAMLG